MLRHGVPLMPGRVHAGSLITLMLRPQPSASFFCTSDRSVVATATSEFNEIESMPSLTSQTANSG